MSEHAAGWRAKKAKRLSVLGCGIALTGIGLQAQSGQVKETSPQASQPLPAFEVASIRPVKPGTSSGEGPFVYPDGRVLIRSYPLKGLIVVAFGLSYWQLAGGEHWMESELYDLEAEPTESFVKGGFDPRYTNWAIEDPHLRQMLQALLIDRFQLKFHREERAGRIYQLERNEKPLRLRPSVVPHGDDNASPRGFSGDVGFAAGRWVLFNTSMPQLAKFAADNVLHAPVLDRTNLRGSFDYHQSNALSDAEANYKDPSDSFLLLIGEIGLRLKASHGPVETLVIDHAERPSPN